MSGGGDTIIMACGCVWNENRDQLHHECHRHQVERLEQERKEAAKRDG